MNTSETKIPPRQFTERGAAQYTSFSQIYLRKLRCADMRRIRSGEPIVGPRWTSFGAAVRYLREDLDAWLEAHRTNVEGAQ